MKKKRDFRKILSIFGPAYLVSVGYMDPGNWATDIAGGSKFGYQLIWVLVMSNIMAIILQFLRIINSQLFLFSQLLINLIHYLVN